MRLRGVSANPSSLKDNTPMEYVTRFLFGGAISVIAGLVAKHYGPAVAGLLLAFPAIFPAGATLIADHEKQKMKRIGRDGTQRGRKAAAVAAEGTVLGCVGLAAFALVCWRMLPAHSTVLTLLLATASWAVIAVTCWALRRRF
jgi:hypothetical protein